MLKAPAALGATILAFASLAGGPAYADERDDRIEALEERVAALSAALEALSQAHAAEAAQENAAPDNVVRLSLPNGRPTMESADGDFSFAVRSLVQLDAAAYDQESGAAQDLSSGTNFRRARLGVEGSVFDDWKYELTFEFGGSGQEDGGKLLAAWIEYGGLGSWRIRGGAFAPSAGLDDSTSASDLLFLERGAATELARGVAGGDGRIGLGVTNGGERWFGSLALTGAVAGQAASYDEQSAIVGRLAGLALKNDHVALHLGANFTSLLGLPDSTSGAGDDSVRLQERPELRVDGTRLVDTGALNADGLSILGGEIGLHAGRLLLTGEITQFEIERTGGLPAAEFGGWHVQAAWSLTGEERAWSRRSGAFASARPARPFDPSTGQWGAFEIAARHSVLDLNDNENAVGLQSTLVAPTAIIRGGEQEVTTLGLNWRPNAALRMMLNYQDMTIERLDSTGAAEIGQDIEAVSVRTQLAF